MGANNATNRFVLEKKMPIFDDKPKRLAKIKGQVVEYYACSKSRSAYFRKRFRYIGKGRIVENINDLEKLGGKMHFWVKK